MAVRETEITFAQGVGGYTGIQDTQVHEGTKNTSYGSASQISVDSSPQQQVLLRFDDIISSSGIPGGATILSATLTLQTTSPGNGGEFHRMLTSWSEASTWNSLSGGVSANGVEAVAAADLITGSQSIGTTTLDVTSSVQDWANGTANYGWFIRSLGSNGWDFSTSEGSTSPQLTVRYSIDDGAPPPANTPPVAVNDSASVTQDGSVIVNVLANDTDLNNDALVVTGITAQPSHGVVAVGSDNRINYTPAPGFTGSDSFNYAISDNRGGTSGASVSVTVNPTPPSPVEHVVTFAQGVGGYTGIQDTQVHEGTKNTSYGSASQISVDSSPQQQVLLRFDDIISSSGIPGGATILSATLTLQTTSPGNGGEFHRMLTSWSEASTWNSLSGGVSANGVEAVAAADLITGSQSIGTTTLDVTSSVQDWANGTANYGWFIRSLGSNGWDFSTSEGSTSPQLTVRYSIDDGAPPPANTPPVAVNDSASVTQDGSVIVNVLANDTDLNNDALVVTGITAQPSHGVVAVGSDNRINYTPAPGFTGSDSFNYAISDNRGGTSGASVSVTVNPTPPSPVEHVVTFAQGVGGYTGIQDTQVHEGTKNTSYGSASQISVDSSPQQQVLLRFDDIISSSGIPGGATILSATLTLQTTSPGNGGEFHRMLTSWSEASTWNSLSGGVSANGVEAVAAADLITGSQSIGTTTLDVTSSVQDWANGTANYGWFIRSLGSNGWDFSTSEGSTSPQLTVRYSIDDGAPPPANTPPVAVNDSASVTQDGSVIVNVLANDTDLNNDALVVTGITAQPSHGVVAVGSDNRINYTPAPGFTGSDSFNYAISDNRGGTSGASVSVTVNPTPTLQFNGSVGYIALDDAAGSTGNFEHTNASKTFFHDGTWWAILPEDLPSIGGAWSIYQFSETTPSPGSLGGWTMASTPLLSSSYHTDIAWDEASSKLYVLMYGSNSSSPYIIQLGYDGLSHSWNTEASINLTSGLNPQIYGSNNDLAIGVDQLGNPLVLAINSGTTKGLHLAYSTNSNLSNWSSTLLDANTTSAGGSNGNSKADFVYFENNGINKVGIVYSQDGSSDSWRFTSHETTTNSASYGAGWSNEVITNSVSIDDHVSAIAHDGRIYAAVKDASNALWLLSGAPEHWDDPIRIVSGGQNTSRPILTLDETNDRIYVGYQESTSPGDVFLKIADLHNPVFDSTSPGTVILQGLGSSDSFINPQGPSHAVGSDTDGYFPIFARESDGTHVWWNGVSLTDYDLIA